MFLVIILAALIILVFIDYLKKIRMNKVLKTSGIVGPKLTLPLIGDILILKGLNVKNIIQFLESLRQKYGNIYRLWVFNKCALFIQDAKYFEAILSSSRLITKSDYYDQLSLWLGDGLVMSTGIKWHQRRRTFTPAFHIKILEQFVEVFDQQAHVMVEKLYQQADGLNSIEITSYACSTTLDVLLETAMGVKINADSTDGLAYVEALESLSHITGERLLNPLKHNDFFFKILFYKSYRTLQKNVQILHEFAEKLIKKRRVELMNTVTKNNKENSDEYHEFGIKKRITFLDILLQTNVDAKALTNEEIREEVDTFTFAGHDTVTLALSYTLYLISRHPEEQKKVFAEILSIIGPDKTKPIGTKELQDLKYLECVIKEAMRLYPPAPVIGRITEEDYKIDDIIIPRNTNLVLLIYAICRDPDYFPRPNEFLPERFSLYNKENINSFAFVPFSAGPRNCIGQRYALLEIKTIVSCVMRNFELLPLGPDVDRIITLVMRSATGVHLGLKPREY